MADRVRVLHSADKLAPCHRLAVIAFRQRDVCHCFIRPCAVPVLDAGTDPNDVARPEPLRRLAPLLHESMAAHDNECLAERMRVPCGMGAGSEGNGPAADTGGRICPKSFKNCGAAA